jgi:hypothetical protein
LVLASGHAPKAPEKRGYLLAPVRGPSWRWPVLVEVR